MQLTEKLHEAPLAARSPATLRLLGPITVTIDGVQRPMPRSKKVRALLAFLALSRRPVARTRLCELFWGGPGDPRSELRWTLSRLRSVLHADHRPRICTRDDSIWLDATDLAVDAYEVDAASRAGIESLGTDRLFALLAHMGGELAEGLWLDREPPFANWLVAQRRSFRALHLDVLRALVGRLAHREQDTPIYLACVEKWLALARFDVRAHSTLMHALHRRGRFDECAEHVAATVRLFESEGFDSAGIRAEWRGLRTGERAPATSTPAAPPVFSASHRLADARTRSH